MAGCGSAAHAATFAASRPGRISRAFTSYRGYCAKTTAAYTFHAGMEEECFEAVSSGSVLVSAMRLIGSAGSHPPKLPSSTPIEEARAVTIVFALSPEPTSAPLNRSPRASHSARDALRRHRSRSSLR